ncbi:RagB/SusD family nutrient uptake outer membrane protein, partial [Alistipes shahii]
HKKYTHAYIYASNALRAVGIAKLGEVQNLWLDKSNAGTIFKLSRPAGSSTIGTLFVGRDYSSVFRPSNELRAQFSEKDVRGPVFFEYGRDRAGAPVWMVTKWFGDASDIGRLDEKMFRAEEMQLIAIEALMMRENPDLAEANRLLNELRAERIEGYTAQTYPGLLAEIIKERRCELVWEGHRLFDARRLKVTMTREGKTISADDYRLTLPIPQAEIDANSGISESDQNYGY